MNDLSTLPASVRYQLEQAQNLAEQNRPYEAQSALARAATTLAQQNPQLCGALIAATLGYTDLTLTETQIDSQTTRTDRHAFGVRYGHDVKTVTNTRTVQRSISLGHPGQRDRGW